jgi:hypothetical protein
MLQKAMELKQRRNLEPIKGNSFAVLHVESLNQIAEGANIKIDSSKEDNSRIINKLINLEQEQYDIFVDEHPETLLPSKLEVGIECQKDPSTSSDILNAGLTPDAPIIEGDNLTWTEVVRRGRVKDKFRSRSKSKWASDGYE